MPIPDITHLQFLVLTIIGGSERSGRYIRDKLAEEGQNKTLAAFYQLMSRLDDGKLVEARAVPTKVAGQTVYEQHYRLTGAGVNAWNSVRDFYLNVGLAPAGIRGGTTNA